MNGLMMDSQLTITTIMKHADRIHRNSEIVSVTADNPQHRYTYKDAFQRVRQLANALKGCGFKRGDRIATLAWNDSGMVPHRLDSYFHLGGKPYQGMIIGVWPLGLGKVL